MKTTIPCLLVACLLIGVAVGKNAQRTDSEDVFDFLAISNKDKLSAASKRAIERNYALGPEWYCEFTIHNVKGDFAYQEGVTRRDPSAVITVGDTYYVYYTRTTGKSAGFGTGDPEKKVFRAAFQGCPADCSWGNFTARISECWLSVARMSRAQLCAKVVAAYSVFVACEPTLRIRLS